MMGPIVIGGGSGDGGGGGGAADWDTLANKPGPLQDGGPDTRLRLADTVNLFGIPLTSLDGDPDKADRIEAGTIVIAPTAESTLPGNTPLEVVWRYVDGPRDDEASYVKIALKTGTVVKAGSIESQYGVISAPDYAGALATPLNNLGFLPGDTITYRQNVGPDIDYVSPPAHEWTLTGGETVEDLLNAGFPLNWGILEADGSYKVSVTQYLFAAETGQGSIIYVGAPGNGVPGLALAGEGNGQPFKGFKADVAALATNIGASVAIPTPYSNTPDLPTVENRLTRLRDAMLDGRSVIERAQARGYLTQYVISSSPRRYEDLLTSYGIPEGEIFSAGSENFVVNGASTLNDFTAWFDGVFGPFSGIPGPQIKYLRLDTKLARLSMSWTSGGSGGFFGLDDTSGDASIQKLFA